MHSGHLRGHTEVECLIICSAGESKQTKGNAGTLFVDVELSWELVRDLYLASLHGVLL